MCQVNWVPRYLSQGCGNCHEVLDCDFVECLREVQVAASHKEGTLSPGLAWPGSHSEAVRCDDLRGLQQRQASVKQAFSWASLPMQVPWALTTLMSSV